MVKTPEEQRAADELERLQREIGFWKGGLLLCISALLLAYFFWFRSHHNFPLSADPASWGQLGDFFGGLLNPLVAFAAFYWLTRSVALQKQELAETRAELSKSANAQALQVQLVALGELNGVFASEIRRAEENLNSIPLRGPGSSAMKRRYFEDRLWRFRKFQKKISIALASGLRGEWDKDLTFEMPSDNFSIEINLKKSENKIYEVGARIKCDSLELFNGDKLSNLRSFFDHFCEDTPIDMGLWTVTIDGDNFGELNVARGDSQKTFDDVYKCIDRKYPTLDKTALK